MNLELATMIDLVKKQDIIRDDGIIAKCLKGEPDTSIQIARASDVAVSIADNIFAEEHKGIQIEFSYMVFQLISSGSSRSCHVTLTLINANTYNSFNLNTLKDPCDVCIFINKIPSKLPQEDDKDPWKDSPIGKLKRSPEFKAMKENLEQPIVSQRAMPEDEDFKLSETTGPLCYGGRSKDALEEEGPWKDHPLTVIVDHLK